MCADILTILNLQVALAKEQQVLPDSGHVQDSGYYNWPTTPSATVHVYSADDTEPHPQKTDRHIRDLEERVASLEHVVSMLLSERGER